MQAHDRSSSLHRLCNPDFAFAKSRLQKHQGNAMPLIATVAGILVVMWRRQFASQSRAAVSDT
jgi:hypothetical protein